MANLYSSRPESPAQDALFGRHRFDTMQRLPRWSPEDPSRLIDSLRDLNQAHQTPDRRGILFVGSPTGSPTRIWVTPAGRQ